VALDTLPPAQHEAVLARLRQADAVGVRDVRTQAALRAAGLDALLLPDPAVLVATLFGAAVREQAARGPVAALREAFPQGHLALQLAAEFGDDATLDLAASQLKAVRARTGLGLVLFCAGAAAWHDDLGLLERLAARFAPHELQVFRSLQLWDVCALLASASAVAGSSLHGWIVAAAFGVPAVGLAKPRDDGKLGAYLHTWAGEAAWPLSGLAEGLRLALEGSSPQARRQRAAQWAQQRHEGLRQLWRPLV
jgi:polysaccharide pyruvyl transferase WcaK-like protein